MRRFAAVLAASALVLLTPGAAHAGSTSHRDGDDVVTALDLKKVTLAATSKRMTITITTHDAFTDADVSGGTSGMNVEFVLSRSKVRGIDVVSPTGAGLAAEICTYPSDGPPIGRKCSAVKVGRVDERTVRITVPRSKIDPGARRYQWRANSFSSQGECATISPACIDKLPGSNRVLTWRP